MADMILASDLSPGHYVCVQGKTPLSWVIQKATKSPFSHVFITGPDGMIAEATLRGVHLSLLSEYRGYRACANVAEPMDATQGGEIWAAAKAMAGDFYSYADIVAIGVADIGWHWNLAFKVLNAGPWRICSQLAVLAGRSAMPPLNWMCSDQFADEVTPAALARRPGVVPVAIA